MTGRTGPVIDAHHHVWDPATRPQRWLDSPALAPLRRRFDLDDLAEAAHDSGVEATVLVQVLADATETRDFLALAAGPAPEQATEQAPGPGWDVDRTVARIPVAGVVGWVDLTAPAVAEQLADLREGPGGSRLVGIRHLVQDEPDPAWLNRPDVVRGLQAVAAAGLVYDLLVTPVQLPAAVAAVRAVPQGRFVLDHVGKPPIAGGWSSARARAWLDPLWELAGLGNCAVKISGLVTEADHRRWTAADLRPWTDAVLAAFGPARAMFGSDWPVCLLAARYPEVVDAWTALVGGLNEVERADVGGGTAQRWYALGT